MTVARNETTACSERKRNNSLFRTKQLSHTAVAAGITRRPGEMYKKKITENNGRDKRVPYNMSCAQSHNMVCHEAFAAMR